MNLSVSRLRPRARKNQSGAAAVEVAFLLPILVTFLLYPMFYARCYWHYTAAQKAAQNATLYLAGVSAAEMRSQLLAKAAGDLAIEIAKREIAELAPGSRIADPQAYCDDVICGTKVAGTLPTTVRMNFTIYMFDNIFNVVETGRYGIPITATIKMRYVGN
jgi:Flp pilus assembly protein TadG